MWALKQDVRRYIGQPVTLRGICNAAFDPRLWAVAVFRFGKRAQKVRFMPLRKMLMLQYFFMYKASEALSKIRISSYSEIGPGLLIQGSGGNVIRGELGSNCEIYGDVQLTSRSDGHNRGWPTLGANVRVHAGAKIVDNVRIGNNVEIGANAVVAADVPDNCVVVSPQNNVRPRRKVPAPECTAASK